MLFNSYIFLFVFLPITFSGYFFLSKYLGCQFAKAFLVIASLVFYAQWNEVYLFLILLSILVNYLVGLALLDNYSWYKVVNKKVVFFFGVAFNLGLLGYFKYFDFFISNINILTGESYPLHNVLLPLAISFFTFQQIAFLTDRYRGVSDKYSFLDYSLFVVFFPQLIAGPIVQPKDTLKQFSDPQAGVINYHNLLFGLILFSIGIFKKVIIADSFVEIVANGFDSGVNIFSFLDAWVMALAYSFQLYFDFSGYTDMALGLGLIFNIRLPMNFNSPYKAVSIQDFWRRWHITLSNFLRNYLYIPLGGNRYGVSRTYTNLLLTFLLGGLWHGAGWTFIIWGAIHGVALCIHRVWTSFNIKMPLMLAWFLTMLTVVTAWVFFRAADLGVALSIVSAMYDFRGIITLFSNISLFEFEVFSEFGMLCLKLLACFVICVFSKNSMEFIFSRLESRDISLMLWQLMVFAFMLVTGVLAISLQEYTEFIYFNF